MSKGDKYVDLTEFLKQSNQDRIILTFDQIEKIIQTSIPPSVKRKPNQLVPSASYSFAYGWKNAGYELIASDLNRQTITLRKNSEKQSLPV
ncbi:MAG: hypothetical protein VB035_01330 [Candidatus Fimivivens sp.]|nr:hypothetical protein [Candidatus Fimivivens sp.]